jgi:phosphoglycolate phosphatase
MSGALKPATLARPRAVVFDWDGTLVDSWRAINEAINATMSAFDLPTWDMAQTKLHVRHSMRNSFPKYFGERWEEAADLFYENYARVHIEYTTGLPGAPNLLDAIRDAGAYMSVISNKNGDYLRRESTALGWDDYFGRLVGATDCAEDKPSSMTLATVLEGTGIGFGPELWYVGDAGIDIELAETAGCVSVMVGQGDPDYPNPPDCLFSDLDTLRAFFNRL